MRLITLIPLNLLTSTGAAKLKAGDSFLPTSYEAVEPLIKTGRAKFQKCMPCERSWCMIKTTIEWVLECQGPFKEGEIYQFERKKRR